MKPFATGEGEGAPGKGPVIVQGEVLPARRQHDKKEGPQGRRLQQRQGQRSKTPQASHRAF